MIWIQLGGSLAAVLALSGLAYLLKLGGMRLDNADRARAIAEDMLVGFHAREALVSEDGGAALVAGNGAIAVLKRHGARVAARRMIPPLSVREAVEGVTIATGEMFGAVTLTGVIVDDVRRLEASLTSV